MKMPIINQDEPKFAMAPMIDMVFLLLVFFMCASHLSQSQSKQLEIPVADKGVVPKDRPERWIVNIDAAGNVFSGKTEVKLADLAGMLKERLQQEPDTRVYIRADATAPHKDVKKVMNELAKAGVDDFIFGVFKPTSSVEVQP